MTIFSKYHSELTTSSGIHIPYAFSYADKPTRESATGLIVGDIGKLALQESDNSLWILISVSPVTWSGVSSNPLVNGYL